MNFIKTFYNQYSKDIICFLAITTLFVVSAIFIGHIYGDLYMDCGREAYLPELILKGKVLYKDIFGMYNPLSYQINSVAYLIFGSSWNTLYNLSYVNAWLMILGLYIIARNFINEYYSSSIIITIMSIFVFGSKTLISYIFPYAFAYPYATTLYTFSLVFFLQYIKNTSTRQLFLSALFIGLSFANKPEFILCIFPMFVVMLHKKESAIKFLITLLLTILPTIFSYGILFLQGLTITDFINYIEFIKRFFATSEQKYYTTHSIMPSWNLYNTQYVLSIFLKFLSLCTIGILYLSCFKKNLYFALISLVFIPAYLQFNINFLENNHITNIFAWTTIALLIIIYLKSTNLKNNNDYMLMFLATSGLLSTSRINFLPIVKVGYGIYALIPLLVIWIYFISLKIDLFKNTKYKLYISITLIILSLTNIFYIKDSTETYSHIQTSKGTIKTNKVTGTVFKNLVNWAEENTTKEDSILMLPEGIMLNFITERPTKLMYYHLIPNHISAIGETNIVKGLDIDKPDYIIVNNMQYKMYNKNTICEDFGLEICKFIDYNYKEITVFEAQSETLSSFSAKIYKLKQ